MIYWTYLNANEIDLVNWDWVYEEKDTVRWDVAKEHFLISFDEEHKDTFEQFNGIFPMDLDQVVLLMDSEYWYIESDI